MREEDLRETLRRHAILCLGHYRLEGHLAGRQWCVQDFVCKEEVENDADLLDWTAGIMAAAIPPGFLEQSERFVVVGLPRGGRYLAPLTAAHLARLSDIRHRFKLVLLNETPVGDLVYDSREQQYLNDHPVIACVDFFMRGWKVRRLTEMLRQFDKSIAGVVCLASRQLRRSAELQDLPVFAPLHLQAAYQKDDCPLCAQGSEPQFPPEHWRARDL